MVVGCKVVAVEECKVVQEDTDIGLDQEDIDIEEVVEACNWEVGHNRQEVVGKAVGVGKEVD